MNLSFADRDFYYGDPYGSLQPRSVDCSAKPTPASAPP